MKLDDFIGQALVSIMNGVKQAREGLNNGDTPIVRAAAIAPEEKMRADDNSARTDVIGRVIQDVHFDVMLTEESGSETKGGLGVAFGIVAVGASGAENTNQTAVNRVQFSIPIIFSSP